MTIHINPSRAEFRKENVLQWMDWGFCSNFHVHLSKAINSNVFMLVNRRYQYQYSDIKQQYTNVFHLFVWIRL